MVTHRATGQRSGKSKNLDRLFTENRSGKSVKCALPNSSSITWLRHFEIGDEVDDYPAMNSAASPTNFVWRCQYCIGTSKISNCCWCASMKLHRNTLRCCLGVVRDSIEAALAYASNRMQFGKSLTAYQLTQKKLADMTIALNKSQLMALQLGRACSSRHFSIVGVKC